MSSRTVLVVAGIAGLTAVALGAFGAHGLQNVEGLDPKAGQWWSTAAHYHLTHALAILGAGVWMAHRPGRLLDKAAVAFVVGVLIFSGSLYAMALTGVRWLGAITPIGGVALMAGWALLIAAAWLGPRSGD